MGLKCTSSATPQTLRMEVVFAPKTFRNGEEYENSVKSIARICSWILTTSNTINHLWMYLMIINIVKYHGAMVFHHSFVKGRIETTSHFFTWKCLVVWSCWLRLFKLLWEDVAHWQKIILNNKTSTTSRKHIFKVKETQFKSKGTNHPHRIHVTGIHTFSWSL